MCTCAKLLRLLTAHIPLFLYPFLHTVSKTRPFEYLRLTSLGVIGALVKVSFYFKHLKILFVLNAKPVLLLFSDYVTKHFYCKVEII